MRGKAFDHPRAMYLKAAPSRLMWPALKWPPITSVGVSAKRENSSRRVTADCGIGIRRRRPFEMRHLAGVMGDVAGEQRIFAVRLDMNAHVSRTMARGRDQGDFIA